MPCSSSPCTSIPMPVPVAVCRPCFLMARVSQNMLALLPLPLTERIKSVPMRRQPLALLRSRRSTISLYKKSSPLLFVMPLVAPSAKPRCLSKKQSTKDTTSLTTSAIMVITQTCKPDMPFLTTERLVSGTTNTSVTPTVSTLARMS